MTGSVSNPALVLLTGGTGYVGGRLLRALLNEDVRVRCLARRPEYLRARAGANVELIRGDVLDPNSLKAAFEGISTAYYLIHSMGAAESFEERDRKGASNFAQAARAAGVGRIVYLGGLGSNGSDLSPHLRSRHEGGASIPYLHYKSRPSWSISRFHQHPARCSWFANAAPADWLSS